PDGEPSPPVDVEFFFSEDPKLNKEVTLTLKVIPNEIVEYAELGINLPDGFMLVGSEGKWAGALKLGEPQSISVKVKAIREGRWEPEGTIYGYFKYPEGVASGYNLYFTPHLYVYIKGDVVQVSNIPPPNNWINIVGLSGSQNDTGLSSNISLSESSALGKEVVLSYIANTSVQLDNAQVSVVFPEKGMEMVKLTAATIEQAGQVTRMNLELIEGTRQYNWRGFIPDNSTVRVEMIVKSMLTGEGYVYAAIGTIGSDPKSQTVVMYTKVDEFSASYNVRKG
ncbi:MAG: hypothetical protein Q7U60_12300, partial [Candidatus Methanoperedens sp.]|nr:hypothetical protein [Candidatus Methanoperedens sp.]